jgi:hypothetical protein
MPSIGRRLAVRGATSCEHCLMHIRFTLISNKPTVFTYYITYNMQLWEHRRKMMIRMCFHIAFCIQKAPIVEDPRGSMWQKVTILLIFEGWSPPNYFLTILPICKSRLLTLQVRMKQWPRCLANFSLVRAVEHPNWDRRKGCQIVATVLYSFAQAPVAVAYQGWQRVWKFSETLFTRPRISFLTCSLTSLHQPKFTKIFSSCLSFFIFN